MTIVVIVAAGAEVMVVLVRGLVLLRVVESVRVLTKT